MQVKFALTEDEFLEYMENIRPKKLPETRGIFQILAIFGAVICFHYGSKIDDVVLRTMLLLCGFVIALNALVGRFWKFSVKRMFKRNELFGGERLVMFTEQGVTSDTATQQLQLKWSAFTHRKESESLFLLFQSPNIANCVPKRVFTPEQSVEFRALLERNIPAK